MVALIEPYALAGHQIEHRHLPALVLGVVDVHLVEHAGPVLGLEAALAGVHREDGVALVELAGEPGLDLQLVEQRRQARRRCARPPRRRPHRRRPARTPPTRRPEDRRPARSPRWWREAPPPSSRPPGPSPRRSKSPDGPSARPARPARRASPRYARTRRHRTADPAPSRSPSECLSVPCLDLNLLETHRGRAAGYRSVAQTVLAGIEGVKATAPLRLPPSIPSAELAW